MQRVVSVRWLGSVSTNKNGTKRNETKRNWPSVWGTVFVNLATRVQLIVQPVVGSLRAVITAQRNTVAQPATFTTMATFPVAAFNFAICIPAASDAKRVSAWPAFSFPLLLFPEAFAFLAP